MANTHTADYYFIECALTDRQKSLAALEEEMASFKPRPISDFEPTRVEILERLRKLNPSIPAEQIEQLVSSNIKSMSSADIQFSNAFSDRFMAEQVTITLLSHALCEAVVNAILALGLYHSKSETFFNLIEKADVKEKWTLGPLCFEPLYQFRKGTHLYETLSLLCKRRNVFVHYKITMHADERKVLDGSKLDRLSFQDAIKRMHQFLQLPYELLAHASTQIRELSLRCQVENLLRNPSTLSR
jgi:hypothetical protein